MVLVVCLEAVEKKKSLALPEFEPTFLGNLASSLFTVLSEPMQLQFL
jgi:hypothetical protein